jgi:hypothetical protein
MTGGMAAALDLDRGTIVANNAADLVLFNPETIADRASLDNAHEYPDGIDMMIVNGVVVIDRGEHTGALPGRLLRRRGNRRGQAHSAAGYPRRHHFPDARPGTGFRLIGIAKPHRLRPAAAGHYHPEHYNHRD